MRDHFVHMDECDDKKQFPTEEAEPEIKLKKDQLKKHVKSAEDLKDGKSIELIFEDPWKFEELIREKLKKE